MKLKEKHIRIKDSWIDIYEIPTLGEIMRQLIELRFNRCPLCQKPKKKNEKQQNKEKENE